MFETLSYGGAAASHCGGDVEGAQSQCLHWGTCPGSLFLASQQLDFFVSKLAGEPRCFLQCAWKLRVGGMGITSNSCTTFKRNASFLDQLFEK